MAKGVRVVKVNRAKMGSRQYVQKKALRARIPYKKFKRAGIAMRNPALMGCTKHYLASLLDPSGETSRGACVPSGFPMASQKVRQFQRGTMQTSSTTGLGFIAWRPSFANDTNNVVFTIAGTTWQTNQILSAATGTANQLQSMTTLPYTAAQCTSPNLDCRFVSGCLRIRYTGTEDTRGGILSLLEEPDHNSVYGQTGDSLLSYENCQRIRPSGDGEWATVNWSGPVRQSEVDYQSAASLPQYLAAILVQAPVANVSQTYEFEVWQNIEYIGSIPTGKTDSHVDDSGMSKVLTAVKKVSSTAPVGSPESKSSIMETISKGTDNIIQHIDTAQGVVKTARKIPDWVRKGVTIVRKIAMAVARRGRGRF